MYKRQVLAQDAKIRKPSPVGEAKICICKISAPTFTNALETVSYTHLANNRLRLRFGVLLCAFLAVCLLRFAPIVLCSGRWGIFLCETQKNRRLSKKPPLRGRCPEGAEGENLAIARNISGSRTVPVSYTHLDVYKRQFFHRSQPAIHGAKMNRL